MSNLLIQEPFNIVRLRIDVEAEITQTKGDKIQSFSKYLSDKILIIRMGRAKKTVDHLNQYIDSSSSKDAAKIAVYRTLRNHTLPQIEQLVQKKCKIKQVQKTKKEREPRPDKVLRAEDLKEFVRSDQKVMIFFTLVQ